ncbi:PREDICTED: synaptogyrin-2, partial [Nanorana parkeri]|uniref:synaptogyrin-2 n=1 Tax=Nanorana parkeri TaxID=125878 RepID=UPI0008541450
LWGFLWFVGFCFLANQWAATDTSKMLTGHDNARAAIAFSFFSILSWTLHPPCCSPVYTVLHLTSSMLLPCVHCATPYILHAAPLCTLCYTLHPPCCSSMYTVLDLTSSMLLLYVHCARPDPRSLPSPGLWGFLWFVGFCFLANQWAATDTSKMLTGHDNARAAIAFSFFSILSWVPLAIFAYKRFRIGVEDFNSSYIDPSLDSTPPYSSYPDAVTDNYQRPPFTQSAETDDGYKPPTY